MPPEPPARHRQAGSGLAGPGRRYAMIVLLLTGMTSLPTLAAVRAGSATIDDAAIGGIGTTPFVPPQSPPPPVVVRPLAPPATVPLVPPRGPRGDGVQNHASPLIRRPIAAEPRPVVVGARREEPVSTPSGHRTPEPAGSPRPRRPRPEPIGSPRPREPRPEPPSPPSPPEPPSPPRHPKAPGAPLPQSPRSPKAPKLPRSSEPPAQRWRDTHRAHRAGHPHRDHRPEPVRWQKTVGRNR